MIFPLDRTEQLSEPHCRGLDAALRGDGSFPHQPPALLPVQFPASPPLDAEG